MKAGDRVTMTYEGHNVPAGTEGTITSVSEVVVDVDWDIDSPYVATAALVDDLAVVTA